MAVRVQNVLIKEAQNGEHHATLSANTEFTLKDCRDLARSRLRIVTLTVHCDPESPNSWYALVPMLPQLRGIIIHTPIAANVEKFEHLAPHIVEIYITQEPTPWPTHQALTATRRVLSQANRLRTVHLHRDAIIELADHLPRSITTVKVLPEMRPGDHPLSETTQRALQRLLERLPSVSLVVLGRICSPQLLRTAIWHCTSAYLGWSSQEPLQTAVDMLRDRPADHGHVFAHTVKCASHPTANPRAAQDAHFQRVDILAHQALPVAHLPELVAVFLL
jgi:hypothetical protein